MRQSELKWRLAKANITQSELAEKLGKSQSVISMYVNNTITPPNNVWYQITNILKNGK